MGWAQRTQDGQHRTRDTRTPLIERAGVLGVVSGDRSTYPQFSGCLMATQYTPGSLLWWELSGAGAVAAARNRIVQRALDHFGKKPFWIWLIDDDHQFAPDLLAKLLRRNVDLVVPMVLFKHPPHRWVAFEFFDVHPDMTDEELIAAWVGHPDPPRLEGQTSGLVELGQGGAAGLLISSEVIHALDPPWFEFGKSGADAAGEDGWFICRARRAGFKSFCDLDVRMSHLNTCGVWPQVDESGTITPIFSFGRDPVPGADAFVPELGTVERWERLHAAKLRRERG